MTKRLDIVDRLLSVTFGVGLDIVEGYGCAIGVSARDDNLPVLKRLISMNADVNIVFDGKSCLEHACENKQIEAVKVLLAAGADKISPHSEFSPEINALLS